MYVEIQLARSSSSSLHVEFCGDQAILVCSSVMLSAVDRIAASQGGGGQLAVACSGEGDD